MQNNPGDYYREKQEEANTLLDMLLSYRKLPNPDQGLIRKLEHLLEMARYVGD